MSFWKISQLKESAIPFFQSFVSAPNINSAITELRMFLDWLQEHGPDTKLGQALALVFAKTDEITVTQRKDLTKALETIRKKGLETQTVKTTRITNYEEETLINYCNQLFSLEEDAYQFSLTFSGLTIGVPERTEIDLINFHTQFLPINNLNIIKKESTIYRLLITLANSIAHDNFSANDEAIKARQGDYNSNILTQLLPNLLTRVYHNRPIDNLVTQCYTILTNANENNLALKIRSVDVTALFYISQNIPELYKLVCTTFIKSGTKDDVVELLKYIPYPEQDDNELIMREHCRLSAELLQKLGHKQDADLIRNANLYDNVFECVENENDVFRNTWIGMQYHLIGYHFDEDSFVYEADNDEGDQVREEIYILSFNEQSLSEFLLKIFAEALL